MSPSTKPTPTMEAAAPGVDLPISMMVELTHRCPLHCVYCSNPLEMIQREQELTTEEWLRVIDQAADLGVLQLHFSGGEPLMRPDFLGLLERASERQLFTNLITSGIGLTDATLRRLVELDLGSFQLSLQGSDEEMMREIAGGPFWKKKMEVAATVREAGLSLSINAVLHRLNLHQAGEMIEMAAALGAERIELANAQYYGWALLNRDRLLPTREQIMVADREIEAMRARYGDRMEIIWVRPDYFDDFPKPCMGGWGSALFSVAPDGTVMPCLSARVIPDLDLPSARDHDLGWIWHDSPAFNAFRGYDWMQEPCRSCPMKVQDHGGCRCQAMLLANDPTATDPVCIYSPHRHQIDEALDRADATAAVESPLPPRPAPTTAEAKPAAPERDLASPDAPLAYRRIDGPPGD